MRNDLRRAVKDFLLRDYREDVTSLNAHLGKRSNAGFEVDMPPIPFTGNPFALRPGNCIAVIGLNPKWLGWDSAWSPREYLPLKREVDALRSGCSAALERYLNLRASYFQPYSAVYYWPYFTKLGGHLAREWFQNGFPGNTPQQLIAKDVFSRFVYKTDMLPWFSKNTSEIDAVKVAKANITPLHVYRSLMTEFLSYLRPRWIQFNGLQMREAIETIFEFEIPLTKRPLGENGKYILCGRALIKNPTTEQHQKIPVLAHQFTNSPGGPQTAEQFSAVAREFRNYLGEDFNFKFDH